jgi:chemotaxis protein MotA
MFFKLGILISFISVISGYLANGGNIKIIMHPTEFVIILGASLGIFMVSNPISLQKKIFTESYKLLKGNPYKRELYVELLVFLFGFFRFARNKNVVEVEHHIDNPDRSTLFKDFKCMTEHREAMKYLCDYMRAVGLGVNNTFELEFAMERHIGEKRAQSHEVASSILTLGDALPALGIIAAVLGVINAMASVSGTPEEIGRSIASALVGTFVGVFTSYCVVSPIGYFLAKHGNDDVSYLEVIKVAISAYSKGYPPLLIVEFARQSIPINYKPSFFEVEKAIRKKIKVAQ